MSSDLEPWDSEMSDLIDAARIDVAPPEGALERVEKRLALTNAASDAAVAAPPQGRQPRRRIYAFVGAALALAAAFAGGFFVHSALRSSRAAPQARATTTARSPKVPGQTYVPPSGSTLVLGGFASSGRELLDDAVTKLDAGDPGGALAALDEHAHKYPTGQLTELREALSIEALARAGRGDEARERGARFFDEYPRSLLRPAVRDALDAIR